MSSGHHNDDVIDRGYEAWRRDLDAQYGQPESPNGSHATNGASHAEPTTGDAEREAIEAEGKQTPAEELDCWAGDLGDLSETPPPQSWLLYDAIGDKPAIPLGRAGCLAAAGGTSKTTECVHLGVNVTLGRPWQGFEVRTVGHVALICAESDRKIMRRQLHRACNAEHLSKEEREIVASRIRVFPLAGRDIALLRRGEYGNLQQTAGYLELRTKLEKLATDDGFTWALIVLDPLSRFAGPETEIDNSAATRFIETVESLCELPGTPTVLVTHHSSKLSIRSGSNDARGVTAIRDGFRFMLLMTRVRTEEFVGAYLVCDKNNEAPEFAARFLIRQDREPVADGWIDVGGTLRLASDEEAESLAAAAGIDAGDSEARKTKRNAERDAAKIATAQTRRAALLSCLPLEPEHLTTAQVEAAMEDRKLARQGVGTGAELRALCDLGLARDLSDGSRARPRQWCRVSSRVQSGGE